MTQFNIIPAIMSGGAGTRLWPLSTEARPKQFHALGGGELSLFAQTVARVAGAHAAVSFAPPLVLCNGRHLELAREHAAAAGAQSPLFVIEPEPRNTAPVAVIAAALAGEIDAEALVLLLPADHIISDTPSFRDALARAAPYARERIVTFGITPDRPATGYGYIKRSAELGDGVFAVERFREKPELALAEAYLAEGGYSWNAGIFLFNPKILLAEFSASAAVLGEQALASLRAAQRSGDVIRLDAALFAEIKPAPVDTAVMEETQRAAVVPCDFGWADLGAWDEIWRLAMHDGAGNAIQGDVLSREAAGNLLRAEGVTLCVEGVNGLVIVATPEAVIVLPRDKAQNVKVFKTWADELARKRAGETP